MIADDFNSQTTTNEQSASTDFQSSELLLEITKSEYQNELERSSRLDTKTEIALAIFATYFFLILQHTSVKQLFMSRPDITNLWSLLVSVLPPVMFLLALILAAFSLVYFVRVIAPYSYQKIDPNCFNDKEKMSYTPREFAAVMVTFYIRALEANRMINDKRVAKYSRGWSCFITSLCLFVLYMIFAG